MQHQLTIAHASWNGFNETKTKVVLLFCFNWAQLVTWLMLTETIPFVCDKHVSVTNREVRRVGFCLSLFLFVFSLRSHQQGRDGVNGVEVYSNAKGKATEMKPCLPEKVCSIQDLSYDNEIKPNSIDVRNLLWFSLFCLLTVLRRVCYLVTVKAAENNSKQFKVSKINQLPVLFVSVTIKPEIEIGSCCHACFCEGGRWNRGVRISRFLYFCAPLPPDSNLSAYQTLKYKCTCVVYHAISWPMT